MLNAREARWYDGEGSPAVCPFEGRPPHAIPQVGININVLQPGELLAMYHWEVDQEDFLVLAGDALLIVKGEERPLRRWDFAHCPAGTEHVIVGAGETLSVVLAVGARNRSTGPDWGGYTVAEAALRRGAGVAEETTDGDVAHAAVPKRKPARYRDGWLTGGT